MNEKNENTKLVNALKTIREEWEEAAGDNWANQKAKVGLVLADMADLAGLSQEEKQEALGKSCNEL